jgi:hypothetical protein
MASIAPFSQSSNGFDPETIDILSEALEDAWQRIEASGSALAKPGYARAMREVVAKHIIDEAQLGKRDMTELSSGAIRFLAANYAA